MIDERDIKFPELLILWQNRDLVDHAPAFGDYRPEFYKGLRRRDEFRVWRFIGDNYLSRYKRTLVRVGFDWMADSQWDIPFPGSVMMVAALSLRFLACLSSYLPRFKSSKPTWTAETPARTPKGRTSITKCRIRRDWRSPKR